MILSFEDDDLYFVRLSVPLSVEHDKGPYPPGTHVVSCMRDQFLPGSRFS